jgi:hypothetical protein
VLLFLNFLFFFLHSAFLGQLMTRMQLNWVGRQAEKQHSKNTFKYILAAFALLYIVKHALIDRAQEIGGAYLFENANELYGTEADEFVMEIVQLLWLGGLGAVFAFCYYTHLILSIAWFIWFMVALTRTRMYIRRTYDIPNACGDRCCGDCCASCWCTCCVLAQMARHTADYNDPLTPAACCTSNGISEDGLPRASYPYVAPTATVAVGPATAINTPPSATATIV